MSCCGSAKLLDPCPSIVVPKAGYVGQFRPRTVAWCHHQTPNLHVKHIRSLRTKQGPSPCSPGARWKWSTECAKRKPMEPNIDKKLSLVGCTLGTELGGQNKVSRLARDGKWLTYWIVTCSRNAPINACWTFNILQWATRWYKTLGNEHHWTFWTSARFA